MATWRERRNLLKNRGEVERGLTPADAVVVGGPGPEVAAVLSALSQGDPDPAVQLLTTTRERHRHDLRSEAIEHLARAALLAPGWLLAWTEREPNHPDACLLRAASLVEEAWEARSRNRASEVDDDQWQAFFTLLGDATPWFERAVQGGGADPVLWEWALVHGRGLEVGPDVLADYEAGLLEADPGHLPGLRQALTWRLPRWSGGTMEAVFEFATERAGAAGGTAAELLPLVAATESVVEGRAQEMAGASDEAMRRAVAWLSGVGSRHPQAALGHSMMTRLTWIRRDYASAYAHLQALGDHVPEYPWQYSADGARADFVATRESVVVLLAAGRRG